MKVLSKEQMRSIKGGMDEKVDDLACLGPGKVCTKDSQCCANACDGDMNSSKKYCAGA